MKFGITGATGLLGRIVIEMLKKKTAPENIVALVRSPQKAADLGVEAREFDYNKPETLSAALHGIDRLLLISGNEFGKRLEQHVAVIEAAKNAGVKLIAYTSLLRADNTTLSLGPEHLGTEQALKSAGIPYVILRHGWYIENYVSSVPSALQYGALAGSASNGKISAAARKDFAEADVLALTTDGHEGKTYELAGDEAFTLSDMAAVISRLSGKNVVYNNLPAADFAAMLTGAGMPEMIAHFFAGTHVSTENGDLFDDGRQLSKLIGHSTTPMAEVVAAAI
jgi:NAD(P)H dehydrogenase (quinone)